MTVMPIYKYECSHCRVIEEVLQSMSETASRRCLSCGKPMVRVLSAPNLNTRNYSGPSEAKYARMPHSEEAAREKEQQGLYQTLRLPPAVKHNPWDE